MLTSAEDEKQAHIASLLRQTAKLGAQPLDEVKEWVLDWPDPLAKVTWSAQTGKAGQEAAGPDAALAGRETRPG